MLLVERVKRRPVIQLVPMIDVLAFLLIFFMIFTTFRVTPAGIDINLPTADSTVEKAPKEIVISVDQVGRMFTSEGERSAASVTQWVRNQIAQTPDLVVTIRADKSTDYENVITAMDAVRTAGAFRLQLAVESTAGTLY